MITLRSFSTSTVTLLLSGLAMAQTPVSSVAAPLEIVAAVNHPMMRLDAIANQARVLCFVQLAENDSLFYLEEFDKIADDLALDAVFCFAVTNEPPVEVEKTVAKESVPTPILITAGDAIRKDYGVVRFPCVVVIDGSGKVRYSGVPGIAGEIRDAAREAALTTVLAPELPASAKAIAKQFDKWQLGDAAKALDKELAKPKLADADRKKLEAAKSRTAIIATRLAWVAARAEKSENWPIAVIALSRLEKECSGIPEAASSKASLERLREKAAQDSAFAGEFSAANECAKAERHDRDRDFKKAHSTYTSVAKSSPDTKSGKFAAARADALKSRVK
jgi:Redoxin